MLKGVHLTLMVGPVVAVPVPRSVLDALTSVEVTAQDEGTGGFSLSFTMSNRSTLPTLFLIAGGSPIPIVRVILVATVNGTPHVLVDGVVTNTQVLPGSDAAHSTLQVIGEDLTTVMDKIELTGLPYPAMPGEAIVAVVLAKYMALGVIPMIMPSILLDVPIPTSQIPTQKGTDLEYIQYLARRVGYVFYLEPGPRPGMSVAYWGPKVKVGVPQPALNINLDAHTNTEQITFSFNSQSRSLPVVFIQNEQTKAPIPIPIPDIGPLNPPLGLVQPLPTKFSRFPRPPSSRPSGPCCSAWPRRASQRTPSQGPAASTCSATAGSSRPARWSVCVAPDWPSTVFTTSPRSSTRSSAGSTSRASRLPVTA